MIISKKNYEMNIRKAVDEAVKNAINKERERMYVDAWSRVIEDDIDRRFERVWEAIYQLKSQHEESEAEP